MKLNRIFRIAAWLCVVVGITMVFLPGALARFTASVSIMSGARVAAWDPGGRSAELSSRRPLIIASPTTVEIQLRNYSEVAARYTLLPRTDQGQPEPELTIVSVTSLTLPVPMGYHPDELWVDLAPGGEATVTAQLAEITATGLRIDIRARQLD